MTFLCRKSVEWTACPDQFIVAAPGSTFVADPYRPDHEKADSIVSLLAARTSSDDPEWRYIKGGRGDGEASGVGDDPDRSVDRGLSVP
jgi:hypothetical protein